MELFLALGTGLVFAAALLSLLRRNFLRIVIGFMLISNAINLVIFTVGRLTRGAPPIIHGGHGDGHGAHDAAAHAIEAANPLPQALILTAIVISFGITAFTFSLAYRVHKTMGNLDTDALGLERASDADPDESGEQRAEPTPKELPA